MWVLPLDVRTHYSAIRNAIATALAMVMHKTAALPLSWLHAHALQTYQLAK